MALFGGKKKAAAGKADGSTFLSDARNELSELYHSYAQVAERDYDDVSKLLADVEGDAWQIVERIAKESYRNGVRKGQGRRSAS